MSYSSSLGAVWKVAEGYFFRIVGPIMMLVGFIGCIINLLVFTKKNLRKNPCTIYFIAFNISNILFICSLLLQLTMYLGFHINPSIENLTICRLRLYSAVLFNTLSPFYLLLACIDRSWVTSPNALTRQRSTQRLAVVCLVIGTIFWSLIHIHVLIYSTVLQLLPTFSVCYFPRGIYRVFIGYYMLMKEILTLLLMALCGLWSIKNVQRIRHGVVSSMVRTMTERNIYSTSSKDRQMIWMLLLDILIYVLFSFSYALLLIYQQITQYDRKSVERIEIETVITNLCLFSIAIPYCTSCYANLIASKAFRKEVKKGFVSTINRLHQIFLQ